jgi:preprotein translocase subunit SecF
MRRLWAHIVIVFAALVAVFASTPALLKKVTTNSDFRTSRQFTFQLSEREPVAGETDPAKLDGNSAKNMAAVMEQRLRTYGVDSYKIAYGGNSEKSDIITISFYAESETKYNNVVNYLTFNGSFAFMNKAAEGKESEAVVVTESEFRNGNAYLKDASVNEFPTIILPVKTSSESWKNLVDYAKDNPDTSEENGGPIVYLMRDYLAGDTPQTLEESNKWSQKVFIPFNYETAFDNTNNWFTYQVGYSDTNGNGLADPDEIRSSFDNANYLLNLFNSEALDFDVTCLRGLSVETRVVIPEAVEKITDKAKLVWNATLTAVVAAIAIIALLLVVFYRLGALSSITTTILTVFFAFLFMINAEIEYSVLAIAALVAVAIISLSCGVIYLNKLKEDAYKGHTLKKANTEASKKSLLPIIDINIVGIVIGIMTYLLGGTAFHPFGAILAFGSLVSLLINTFGLKLLMWLPTNTTKLSGKYGAFGINKENVPNHMAEEKQRFYGAYAEKDFTKRKKPIGIIAGGLFVVALVGLLVGVSIKGGIVKGDTSKVVGQEIYVTNTYDAKKEETDNKLNKNTLQSDVLEKIMLLSGYDAEMHEVYTPLKEYVTNVDEYVTFTSSKTVREEEEDIDYVTTYYVLSLKGNIDLSTKSYYIPLTSADAETLSKTLQYFLENTNYGVSIKNNVTYVTESNIEWTKVLTASAVAVAILTVYLMLRYRLSRGLASIAFPVLGATITLGVLVLLNVIGLSLPLTVIAAIPLMTILSYAFMIPIMNREREMVIDDKSRDVTIEHRKELSIKSLGIALTPVLASAVLGIYLLINFFGFGVIASSYLYLIAIIGSLITLGFIVVLYMPIANLLYALFKKISIERKPRERKNKKSNKPVKKSAEPEEAIFIGIND